MNNRKQSLNKRSSYLINPRFQARMIAYHVIVSLVISAVFYGAIRFFFWKLYSLGQSVGLPEGHIFFEFLAEQVGLMTLIFSGASLVISLLLAVHGLFLSHKIAGPLYRLRAHMEAVSNGEALPPVQFRKNDHFKELEEAYNKQLEYLCKVQTQAGKPKDRRKVA